MVIYRTVSGDTWDTVAKEVYGDELKADQLMDHNREFLEYMIFPPGIEIKCPDLMDSIGTEDLEGYPSWRV